MKKAYFVSGIGTEVGKTVVSAFLCRSLDADYWKPIQAGELDFSDSAKVALWASRQAEQVHPEAFRFSVAASPHYASLQENPCPRERSDSQQFDKSAGHTSKNNSVVQQAMNERERAEFCSDQGEKRRRSGATARLFNEVQHKIGRLQPFDDLPDNANVQQPVQVQHFSLPATDRPLIVEGAGGLLVPINESQTMLDLIQWLNIPVLLVARNYLGSINHTLLSIAAIRAANIPLAGLIYSGQNYRDNIAIIEKISGVAPLLQLPELEEVSPQKIAILADRYGASIRAAL